MPGCTENNYVTIYIKNVVSTMSQLPPKSESTSCLLSVLQQAFAMSLVHLKFWSDDSGKMLFAKIV